MGARTLSVIILTPYKLKVYAFGRLVNSAPEAQKRYKRCYKGAVKGSTSVLQGFLISKLPFLKGTHSHPDYNGVWLFKCL